MDIIGIVLSAAKRGLHAIEEPGLPEGPDENCNRCGCAADHQAETLPKLRLPSHRDGNAEYFAPMAAASGSHPGLAHAS